LRLAALERAMLVPPCSPWQQMNSLAPLLAAGAIFCPPHPSKNRTCSTINRSRYPLLIHAPYYTKHGRDVVPQTKDLPETAKQYGNLDDVDVHVQPDSQLRFHFASL
jgi:hypothetical protein